MDLLIRIAVIGVAVVLGFLFGFFFRKYVIDSKLSSAEQKVNLLINNAKKEASTLKKEILLEGKEEIQDLKVHAEEEIKKQKFELRKREDRLLSREDSIEKKAHYLEKKENEVNQKKEEFDNKNKELNGILNKEILRLEAIAELTKEEAKAILMKKIEDEAKYESVKALKNIEAKLKEDSDTIAKKIISQSIQRCALDQGRETPESVVNLPNDEMKGRIIGREGRNIRALESATGVDFIVDDTPEAVIISGFDPVRREVARQTLEKLISDGRIHPGRIEELVEKVKKDVEKNMKEDAEKVLFELGIQNVHPEIVKLLGRLKYRTSYGQNNLWHAREVAYICGMMASELRLDVTLCKRMALLHDIGKALTHEHEGAHTKLGLEAAKKYGENLKGKNAIASHHGEIEPNCVEG